MEPTIDRRINHWEDVLTFMTSKEQRQLSSSHWTRSLVSAQQDLPAATLANDLAQSIAEGRNAVVIAPPGSGKSTFLPITMLEALPEGRIVVVEPRRLAAQQVAWRMALLLEEQVGQTVGYQIRFERRVSAATRIEVVTEGVMARRLIRNPMLEGIHCIVFDEFHERNLQSDMAFCLVRHIQALIRPDIRLVVMSATLDAQPIATALSARVLACDGRLFPVCVKHASTDTRPSDIAQDVAAAVSRAHREQDGDILAFLPGQADIQRCADILKDSLSPTRICPLYGNLSQRQQQEAIAPSAPGERKVVLSTPIAETSLTIEGIRVVIDSGYCRKPVFNPTTGLTYLETVRISLDMANQRSGRAGRVAPGICFRLWTKSAESRMDEQRQPEILHADLAPMALSLAAFGETEVLSLPWLTLPPKGNLFKAVHDLSLLGALSEDGMITPMGRKMVAFPCHPRLAKMILQARDEKERQLVCDIAALLEEKDPMGDSESSADLYLRISELRRARHQKRIGSWGRVNKVAEEYARMMGVVPGNSYVSSEDIGILVAAAYPERIAQALDHNGNYRLADGQQAAVDASDPIAGHTWLAVSSLHTTSRGCGRIYLAAAVNVADLDRLASWQDHVTWITHRGGIIAQREKRLGVLVMDSKPLTSIDNRLLLRTVCDAVAKEGLSLLDWSDQVKALQLRIALVAGWHPELSLPDLSTDHLLEHPDQWLLPYLTRDGGIVTTVAELHKIDLSQVLWGLLNYEQQQAVDRLAPTHLTVPSGHKIKVKYRIGAEAPVLSVRLQECFGMAETPRVDNGRIPVLMELLSPGFKPVQLTTDMRNFWQTTYFDVRKELRRRYPKHHWPDNPMEAIPK